ncbi:MAG: ribosome maturation factor RimP [Gammaproteobacteria bacterium]|nr:ribosome maturation factor RimP [Gammaproteobacteria bacterium]
MGKESTEVLITETRLEEVIRPTVEHLGYVLWGVERLGTGKRSRVCVYIDAEQGITFDDCEVVSEQLMAVLEVEDCLEDNQVLEVSSPGMDRKLFNQSQYQSHIGQEVDVRLHFMVNGRKRFRGVMSACSEEEIVVGDQHIEFDKVRFTRVVPQFD